MKKLLAILLSLVMVFTLVPLGVLASEAEESNHTTLVDKAVAAFPEYAERLLNPNYTSAYSRSATDRVLVVKETRSISGTESITYAEYSDGVILLSDYDFTYDSSLDNSYHGSTSRNVVIDIEAACVLNGTTLGSFFLDNVSYILYYGDNNFDCITSAGTGTRRDGCTSATCTLYKENEDLEGYATLSYKLAFRVSSSAGAIVESYLTLYVGEDTAMIYHEGRL